MEYLPIILSVALAHLLAAMSPGPDFMLITRNSLIYSRKTGIYSAIGLALGVVVHIAYCLAGIAILISRSVLIFNIIKFIGAGYLMYIGYKSLTSKSSDTTLKDEDKKEDISEFEALKMGFITNVTNPKVTLFFLSLFTVLIVPETPLFIKLFMGIEMTIVTALWFIFVAYIASHHLIKNRVKGIQHYAEKFIGVVLIGLGIKVALSTK